MVDDEHHGKGIATLLLEHLAAIARTNGIERFTAQTLGDNRGMLAVFAKAGWPVHRRFESGVIDVDFPLADTSEFIDSVERREQRADSRAVARLLLPTSIAVIGASDRTGFGRPRRCGRTCTAHARCPRLPGRTQTTTRSAGVQAFRTGRRRARRGRPGGRRRAGRALARHDRRAASTKRVRGAVVITAVTATTADVRRARRCMPAATACGSSVPSSFGIASPRPEVAAAGRARRRRPSRRAASRSRCSRARSAARCCGSPSDLQLGLSWFVSLGDKRRRVRQRPAAVLGGRRGHRRSSRSTPSRSATRASSRASHDGCRRASRSSSVRTGAALVGSANAALYRADGRDRGADGDLAARHRPGLRLQPLMSGDRVAVRQQLRAAPTVLAAATLEAADLQLADSPSLDWRSDADDYGGGDPRGARRRRGRRRDGRSMRPATFSGDQRADRRDRRSGRGRPRKPVVAVMLGCQRRAARRRVDDPEFLVPGAGGGRARSSRRVLRMAPERGRGATGRASRPPCVASTRPPPAG